MQNPFIPEYQQLPITLPVFPLINAVVMPGAQLPLNIFEPRYLNMVQDVLASHHLIGMVQPDEANLSSKHQLCSTGCAARISSYNETADGRIEIILTGVCRFDIGDELPTTRGYRLITPEWSRFKSDYDLDYRTTTENRKLFYSTLTRYLNDNQLHADIKQLEKLAVPHLINILTTSLPLPHKDKQSIIDAVSFNDRYQLLMVKMEMASSTSPSHLKH